MHVMTDGSVFRAARLWTRRRHFGLARGLPQSCCPGFHLAIPEMEFTAVHACLAKPQEKANCVYRRTRLFVPVSHGILDNVGQNQGFSIMARRISESILDSRD